MPFALTTFGVHPPEHEQAGQAYPDSLAGLVNDAFHESMTGQRPVTRLGGGTHPFRLRGHLVTVDLTQVDVVVSPPRRDRRRVDELDPARGVPDDAIGPCSDGWSALITTEEWAGALVDVAINANFFWTPAAAVANIRDVDCSRSEGLVISGGRMTAEPEQGEENEKGTCSLLFTRQGAHVADSPTRADFGWRGRWRDTQGAVSGNRLIRDGTVAPNLGPQSNIRNARTAVGVTHVGRALTIVMIELQNRVQGNVVWHGEETPYVRGEDVSDGARLGELARFFAGLEVQQVVNLDGSGSSCLVYQPSGQQRIVSVAQDRLEWEGVDWQNLDREWMEAYGGRVLEPRPCVTHLGFRQRDDVPVSTILEQLGS